MNINYVLLLDTYKLLTEQDNDLEVLDNMISLLPDLANIASMSEQDLYSTAVDDTTTTYLVEAVQDTKELISIFNPLVDDFIGIDQGSHERALELLPNILIAVGVLLYKKGYESLINDYAAHGSIDTSRLELDLDLMGQLRDNYTHVMDTMKAILSVFESFNTYFAEYQVSSIEQMTDLVQALEEHGFGVESISKLTKGEVKKLLEE